MHCPGAHRTHLPPPIFTVHFSSLWARPPPSTALMPPPFIEPLCTNNTNIQCAITLYTRNLGSLFSVPHSTKLTENAETLFEGATMAGSGSVWVVLAAVLAAVVVVEGHEDAATMATECSADFQKVVGCMNFATGKATVPTKDCCASVTEMRANSPKCMCFIIQQSKNGSEQIKSLGIRTDKLLQLPIACDLKNTSVSECPKLLGLAANSTDAAIFTSPTTSPSAPAGTTASKATPTAATKADSTSGAMELRPHFMAIGVAVLFSAAFAHK